MVTILNCLIWMLILSIFEIPLATKFFVLVLVLFVSILTDAILKSGAKNV